MKHEKSCGAIVVRGTGENFKVLLICHVNGGHWSFPKGHVEKEETEIQTALREIREETGLEVMIDAGFRHVTTYRPAQDITKDVVYFIAEFSGGQVVTQKEEVREAGWYSFEEAAKIITYEKDRKLLKSAIEYLSQN